MDLLVPMKPLIINQQIPTGYRILGKDDSLLHIGRSHGIIPFHVPNSTPYLLFKATSGKQYNIAYFRTSAMRDVAFYEILNPSNSSKKIITLDLKTYFHKYSRVGSQKTKEEFRTHINSAFKLPKVAASFDVYLYITPKYENPEDYFKTPEGRAALFLFCRDILKIPPVTRHYSLDLLIRKTF